MPHIHTEPGQHDHTISAFIVRLDMGDGPKLILHMHKKLGKYLHFGGHIELDEDPWQTLTHEIEEESGYEIGKLKILQPPSRMKKLSWGKMHPYPVSYNTHPFNDEHSHINLDFAFVANGPPSKQIGKGESKEFIYVTRDELIKIPKEQMFPDVREIGLFIFDECLENWEQVETNMYS